MSTSRHKYIAVRPAQAPALQKLGPRKWAYHEPVTPHRSAYVFLKKLLLGVLITATLTLALTLTLKLYVDGQTYDYIYPHGSAAVPYHHVAMVFGAGLNSAGGPSKMLYDRVEVASQLYKENRVDKLLMTGDNSTINYNEVEIMRQTAVQLGVADEDIVLDYAGFSTYDSCYRARDIFGLTDATLVTQRFHLPRAVFTCRQLGIDAVGVDSDVQSYPTYTNEVRELPALMNSLAALLTDRKPHFLGPKVDVDATQER